MKSFNVLVLCTAPDDAVASRLARGLVEARLAACVNRFASMRSTYVWEGEKRAVGQQTIVIPGKDAVFVMQLNGEAPKGQEQPVVDAIKLIREQTKITLPS